METVWTVLIHLIVLHTVKGSVTNVARNRPASMSSNYNDAFNAARAVDGNTTAVYPDGIINTNIRQSFAWWKVDLERDVQEATVKIYFRTDYAARRNGVQIYTSTTPFSSYPEGQLCYTVTGDPSSSDIDDVVSVTCPGSWRYLLVYTNTDNDGQGPILDFGEMMVLVCSDGTYGENCSKTCNSRHCVTMATTCVRDGRCPGDCQTGWTGVDCTQVCDSKYYASGCIFPCNNRKCFNSWSSCDHVTGLCEGGCQSGYKLMDCVQKCSPGTYGGNCSQLCSGRHCLNSSASCDPISGSCDGDCRSGWRGTDCTQECPAGTFGVSCTSCSTRHCQGDLDCPADGRCSQGCQDGWTLNNCTQVSDGGAPINTNCGTVVGAVVGAVVGSVLVVVLVGIGVLLCLIRQGRLQWVKVTNKNKSNQNAGDNTQMRNLGQEHVSDTEHAHSSYACSYDYAELNAETQTGNKDYDVIQQKHYQNA